MTKTTTDHGSFRALNFHAEKPMLLKPKIKGSKIVNGVKYYLGEGKRVFRSDLFDRMFKINY